MKPQWNRIRLGVVVCALTLVPALAAQSLQVVRADARRQP